MAIVEGRTGGVHERLAAHVLVDGYRLVYDPAASRGTWLVDARSGTAYLDFYTFFSSAPLGHNHPKLAGDPEFLGRLTEAALSKPANPDVYSEAYARFVETFARVAGDAALPHLFFVEGGALAVENALKCAFDWKSRRNERDGCVPANGLAVLHLTHAFHGRSGYTLSLTNTDPIKTDRFPKFNWPRIKSPALSFPLAEHATANRDGEDRALAQAAAAFAADPHGIACFIAEPIQGEGGDNHLSGSFLLAMQDLCHRHDALFVLDEVQTGIGTTGSMWAYTALGLAPDIVAFAKKAQVGGIMAGRRVDEVADNVFNVSGRINSTWGGGLVDMVRSTRMLEVIEEDGLVERAASVGEHLRTGLERLCDAHPDRFSNARGRGLMCAVDLPDRVARDATVRRLREDERVLALGSGTRSLRVRPPLTLTEAEVDQFLGALDRTCAAGNGGAVNEPN